MITLRPSNEKLAIETDRILRHLLRTNEEIRKGDRYRKIFDSVYNCLCNPEQLRTQLHLIQKMSGDLDFSVVHDAEVLPTADVACRERIVFTVEKNNERGLECRLPSLPFLEIPTPADFRGDGSTPDSEIARRFRKVITHSKNHPFVINCECIEAGPLAALLSLKEKYGLKFRLIYQDGSGRKQVARITHDDESDIVITANAPFFLFGKEKALKYRYLAPIHVEAQRIIYCGDDSHLSKPARLFVYSHSSAEEHLLALKFGKGSWTPFKAEVPFFDSHETLEQQHVMNSKVERIDMLESLIDIAHNLSNGDCILLWEPLCNAVLNSRQSSQLRQIGIPYYHWISFFYHSRFESTNGQPLISQLWHLFLTEWQICRQFRTWAASCLLDHVGIASAFETATGLSLPLSQYGELRLQPTSNSGVTKAGVPPQKPLYVHQSGEASIKLISALLTHHQFDEGYCGNYVPIGCNNLAVMAGVGKTTSHEFFRRAFNGHKKYISICKSNDPSDLVGSLKKAIGDIAERTYGRSPDDRYAE